MHGREIFCAEIINFLFYYPVNVLGFIVRSDLHRVFFSIVFSPIFILNDIILFLYNGIIPIGVWPGENCFFFYKTNFRQYCNRTPILCAIYLFGL